MFDVFCIDFLFVVDVLLYFEIFVVVVFECMVIGSICMLMVIGVICMFGLNFVIVLIMLYLGDVIFFGCWMLYIILLGVFIVFGLFMIDFYFLVFLVLEEDF